MYEIILEGIPYTRGSQPVCRDILVCHVLLCKCVAKILLIKIISFQSMNVYYYGIMMK
jgi:hypothetical protein